MTEREWLTATDARPLLDHMYPLRSQDSVGKQERASRLYLLECARRAWDRLPGVCRVVVSITEQVYQKKSTDKLLKDRVYPLAEALVSCRGEAELVNPIANRLVELQYATSESVFVDRDFDPELWVGYSHLAYLPLASRTPHIGHIPRDLHSADLVREVFGNPIVLRPDFDGSWRTSSVINLAQHARRTGDFSALPVLADALEEAGCDHEDLLDHLRHHKAHVRGCWALDLVLD
jgi:hypothetical protein